MVLLLVLQTFRSGLGQFLRCPAGRLMWLSPFPGDRGGVGGGVFAESSASEISPIRVCTSGSSALMMVVRPCPAGRSALLVWPCRYRAQRFDAVGGAQELQPVAKLLVKRQCLFGCLNPDRSHLLTQSAVRYLHFAGKQAAAEKLVPGAGKVAAR